jgi:hypothetical protein
MHPAARSPSRVAAGSARAQRAARRRSYRRRHPLLARLDYFVNDAAIAHEIFAIAISYLLIVSAFWNEELLGMAASPASHAFEIAIATMLVLEITSRIMFTQVRDTAFWAILSLDIISLLSVSPHFRYAVFGRVIRGVYATVRLTALLDALARRTKNASYLLPLFPLIVPIMASLVYAFERNAPGTPVHNYLDALGICFSFALSLGNVKPVTTGAMTICGALFVMGIVCIGIIINTISQRYDRARG